MMTPWVLVRLMLIACLLGKARFRDDSGMQMILHRIPTGAGPMRLTGLRSVWRPEVGGPEMSLLDAAMTGEPHPGTEARQM